MARKLRSVAPRVLLVGAGHGEATCGILYLAAFLRRNGVEAWVRLYDDDRDRSQMKRSLEALLAHVRPSLLGISLKWFSHLSRGLELAKLARSIDPGLRLVAGGNSATYFWRELSAQGVFDELLLGDGEQPLLALARGAADVPNRVSAHGRAPLSYVQGRTSKEVYYSHFDELFLSEADRASFSGWIQPGKGCSENCVYCGGTRGMEQAAFGRPTSFIRPAESVARDHAEVAPRAWQLRYDFAGGTAEHLRKAWANLDLSRHSTTYFLWGVPEPSLVEALAQTFARVYLVLDIGCFSQLQRLELIRRGLLKPCPTDRQLLQAVKLCRRFDNVRLEVCGIAGLPHSSDKALSQELPLVEQLLEQGVDVGCQRLECQPGALVTQHPDRFGMLAQANTFEGFVDWFAKRRHQSDGEFPMIRFRDREQEVAVQRSFERVLQRITRPAPAIGLKTVLARTVAYESQVKLGAWLGTHVVPTVLRNADVRVLRSADGHGLALAPALQKSPVPAAPLEVGATARAVGQLLDAFEVPVTAAKAASQLGSQSAEILTAIEQLVSTGFLMPLPISSTARPHFRGPGA